MLAVPSKVSELSYWRTIAYNFSCTPFPHYHSIILSQTITVATKWHFVLHRESALEGAQGKYFTIKSADTDLYWEVAGHGDSQITLNRMDPCHLKHHLFYEDVVTGTIKAKINNLCVDVEGTLLAITVIQIFLGHSCSLHCFINMFLSYNIKSYAR